VNTDRQYRPPIGTDTHLDRRPKDLASDRRKEVVTETPIYEFNYAHGFRHANRIAVRMHTPLYIGVASFRPSAIKTPVSAPRLVMDAARTTVKTAFRRGPKTGDPVTQRTSMNGLGLVD